MKTQDIVQTLSAGPEVADEKVRRLASAINILTEVTWKSEALHEHRASWFSIYCYATEHLNQLEINQTTFYRSRPYMLSVNGL
jgi:hypothetical protein